MARDRGCWPAVSLFLQHGHQQPVRLSVRLTTEVVGPVGRTAWARGSTTASFLFVRKKAKSLICPVGTAGRMPLLACLQQLHHHHHHHQADGLPCVFLVFFSISDPADTVHCHSALLHVVHIQRDPWFQCDTCACRLFLGGSSG